MGTRPQTLNSWKLRGVRELPSQTLLEALARETRTPYRVVLEAALRDTGYLHPEDRVIRRARATDYSAQEIAALRRFMEDSGQVDWRDVPPAAAREPAPTDDEVAALTDEERRQAERAMGRRR